MHVSTLDFDPASLLQLLINGTVTGASYALLAAGLLLVYRAFKFINFAHGELAAWGAYLALLFMHHPFSLPFQMAVLPALGIVVVMGFSQDKFVYGPLREKGHLILLTASLGLSFLLRNVLILLWGNGTQHYGLEEKSTFAVSGLAITDGQAIALAAALTILGFFALFMKFTIRGKNLRAFFDDRDLARSMGISMDKIAFPIWIMASFSAGCGGIIMAANSAFDPLMAPTGLIKAFAAFLLGGGLNIGGVLLGGLLIGAAAQLTGYFVSPRAADYLPFLIIVAALLLKRHRNVLARGDDL